MPRQDNSRRVRRLTLTALLVAVALLLSYIESLLPLQLPVPGMKLGLANAAVMVTLYLLDLPAACLVSALRVLLVSALFGNSFAMLYSLSGAFVSLLVMALCRRSGLFSTVGVSVAGGVAHNAGQILAAVVLLDNLYVAGYFPFLVVSGVVAGVLIGIVSALLLRRLEPAAKKLR